MSFAPPNILYLHCHDAGRQVQPYGYAVETPHLQRLAEEGVLFRQAFCVNPTCSPSRAGLLTGCYPHQNGMLGLAHRGFRLNDYGRHWVHTLRRAGYRSALAGVQHIAHAPAAEVEEIGYDEVLTLDGGFEEPTAAAESFLARRHDAPFFLSVGYFAPHRGGDRKEGFPTRGAPVNPGYVRPPDPLPDTPETRADMAEYQASVRSTDAAMGRVLDALDRHGLADHTLVIATTDHGIAFPGMKCSLTDHGTGVMLILRGPGGFAGGRVLDAMVTHLDVFPTLCELAGVAPPPWLEGASLLPLVRGDADRLHEAVFAEVNVHAALEPMRAVRTERWKYIRRYDDRHRAVLPNCDNSVSKTRMVEAGWADAARPRERLYDLLLDPHEACNRAADPACASVLREMRGRLDAWMRETDDPLAGGSLPLPSGARLTDPDDYAPGGDAPKPSTGTP